MLLFALACAPKTPPQTPVPAEPAGVSVIPSDTTEGSLAFHMGEHFSKTRIARDSFVQGELDEAREALTWIAEHPTAKVLPPEAVPYVEQMRTAALRGAQATTPAGTARGIAGMGAACGSCHGAFGYSPRFESSAAPEPSSELVPHMMRHQWAIESLWVGLVGPSQEAWLQGAEVMNEAALPAGAYEVEGISAEAWDYAQTAHSAAMDPGGNRAQAYATVIASCAGCHAEMRGE